MEENKTSLNVDVKADLTRTIENTYENACKEPLKSAGKIVTTFLDFFRNTVMLKMQKYNLYAESKLNAYAQDLEKQLREIPPENLTSPRVNILGPAIDGLKYNLDEEYIKEMFTKILLSEMNTQTQSKVLPCYVEIVKQLSCCDAQILNHLNKNIGPQSPILKIKELYSNGSFSYVSNNLILINDDFSLTELQSINIDNLLRLNLIEISLTTYLHKESIYSDAFNKLPKSNKDSLGYTKGIIRITDFGANLIDICLS